MSTAANVSSKNVVKAKSSQKDAVNQIEKRSIELNANLKKNNEDLIAINSAIKKFREQRKQVISNIGVLTGALSAFSESATLFKETNAKETASVAP